jgi:excisionase family DNA binding protein
MAKASSRVATPSPAPLLAVEDVAARLRVTVNSVRQMRARGKLPKAIKIGNLVRWESADIEKHIENLRRA